MNNLIWFTNNLRLRDNESLVNACNTSGKVISVYFFNPAHFEETKYGFKKTEKYRAQFLIESVNNLKENLAKLNISLLVFHKKPEVAIKDLVSKYKINQIFIQKEWTQEEVQTLKIVKKNIPSEINIIESYDQFLIHPEDIPFDGFKKIPKVFTDFRKKSEKYASIREPFDIPEALSSDNLVENTTTIPTLQNLGLNAFEKDSRSAFTFQGGETEAWKRLDHYFWETHQLQDYKKTRNGLVGIDYSSKFSAWLANGCISAKSIYWEVKKFEKEIKKNQDTYWLIFELFWRDFFKYISLKHGNSIFYLGGILQKEYDWNKSLDKLEQWIDGSTQYDFVNANMREIKYTGWMSNRGRQNVASFWAKEQMQDWRIGAAYFESILIDYDVHSNWGNWMYNAGVGNDPRDRKFNIERQANMYDPEREFVNLWLSKK